MSALATTPLRPEHVTPAAPPARRLRALERPVRRTPRLIYALSAIAAVGAIVGTQIALSLATTQDAFVLADLRQQQRELSLESQGLQAEITGLGSPQYLAANADAAGMVLSGSPAHLRLSDAAVVGAGVSAAGSTVRPNDFPEVQNSLVADTPLLTRPTSTITGTIEAPEETVATLEDLPGMQLGVPVVDNPDSSLPPLLGGGLPSPRIP